MKKPPQITRTCVTIASQLTVREETLLQTEQIFENLTVPQLVTKFLIFMKPGDPLPVILVPTLSQMNPVQVLNTYIS
jgi:hypothetical protein